MEKLPVEHNPLRNCNDALLGLIESRELGLNRIIGIRHVSAAERARKTTPVVGLFPLNGVTQLNAKDGELLVWVLVTRARSVQSPVRME
jgi:hypothetical protein